MTSVLSLTVLIPIVGAILVLIAGRVRATTVPWIALLTALVTCGVMIGAVVAYDFAAVAFNATNDGFAPTRWFGIDGINLWLLVFSTLLMLSAVLVTWESVRARPDLFFSLLLLGEAGILCVLSATNVAVFFVGLEISRVVLFFLVGGWGRGERRQAAVKFFLFTLVGSGLIFLGLMLVVLSHHWMSGESGFTLSLSRLIEEIPRLIAANQRNADYWAALSPWMFAVLLIGFAIHIPLFPLHTWWQTTDFEAPSAGNLMLRGAWLNLGVYGILRLVLPLFPQASGEMSGWVLLLAAIGVIYGALLALVQDDFKRLASNLVLSGVSLSVLGLFSLNAVGISGALLQMCSHGLSMGILACVTGMLFQRYRTLEAEGYGGFAGRFPRLTGVTFVAVLSLSAVPFTSGFAAIMLTLTGVGKLHAGYAVCGLVGLILSTWGLVRFMQRMFSGKFREPVIQHRAWLSDNQEAAGDLNLRELAATLPLVAVVLLIGLAPQTFLDPVEPSVQRIVASFDRERGKIKKPATVFLKNRPTGFVSTTKKPGDNSAR